MPENSCVYSKNFRNVNTTNQLAFQKTSTTAKSRSTTATNATRNLRILYRLYKHWERLINKQGGCRTLKTFKTLKSDQVALKTLKNKYFSVENLENLEMRVYYRESIKT